MSQSSTPSRDRSQNLTLPRVRCFLDRVQKLMALDGQIKIGAGGLSSADPFGHPHEKLRNVEGRAGGRRRWNPAIARRYREVGQRLASLRTAQTQFGVLHPNLLRGVDGRDREVAVRTMDLEQERRPVGGAAFDMDRCDRAALEDSAEEHLVGRSHLDHLARLDDLDSRMLCRDYARHFLEFPEA